MAKSDFQVEGPSPVASERADAYERERDLPKLMPHFPSSNDAAKWGAEYIVEQLTKLAEATLEKVTSAHGPCELSQLLAVVSALKAEKRNLAVIVARQAAALRAVTAEDGMAGKGSRPTDAANAENAAAGVDVAVAMRIRARRLLLGLSHWDVSSRLGLTFTQVQKYENGVSHVSPGRLYQLAKLFGVPVQFFFGGLDPTAAGHGSAFDASEPRGAGLGD